MRFRSKSHIGRWWALYVALLAIAAGVVATHLLFFTPNSVAELSFDDDVANAPVDADDLSGEWSADTGSVAGYRVREELATLSAPSDAVGRTSEVVGAVEIEDDGSSVTALRGSMIEVDLTSLESDESRRDERVRSSGLESDFFPTATFELTDDIDMPTSLRDGATVSVDAPGEMTLHGVTRPVTVPLEIRLSGATVQVVGSQEIMLSDYEIDVSSFGGFVSVEDTGTIEFELTLAR